MYPDIENLQSFYAQTELGAQVQRALQAALKTLWSERTCRHVLGYGYALPLLEPFLETSTSALAFMPAQQGVQAWPEENITSMVHEKHWPLESQALSHLVFLHALENSEQAGAVLDEAWRTLEPNGRVIFVVPNRLGLWARRESTPFGYGRPYTLNQLTNLLRRHRFTLTQYTGALYFAPSHSNFLLRIAKTAEAVGVAARLHYLSGALVVEAIKSTYAPVKPNASHITLPRGAAAGAFAHAKVFT